jgi:hypothetical protein
MTTRERLLVYPAKNQPRPILSGNHSRYGETAFNQN